MPMFNVDSGEMAMFKSWLQGVEGKRRSEKEAHQISVDVSKVIKYCTPHFHGMHYLMEKS